MSKWKMKLNPETNSPIIDEENRIIYVDPEGKELGLNPPAMFEKIHELGRENQKHRTKFDQLKAKLDIFNGVEDLAEWKQKADEALATLANFNDKDYLKAEKVEKLKQEITSAYEEKLKRAGISYSEKEKVHLDNLSKKEQQIRRLLISNKFAVSKYFSGGGDKSVTILPSNIAEDHFGRYFKVEDGPDGLPTTKAYYANGDMVLSRNNPGEPADFEEAIGLILDQYPNKDSIIRSGSSGSGSSGGSGNAGDTDDLAQLRKRHEEAKRTNNITLAIALSNKIFALEKARKAG